MRESRPPVRATHLFVRNLKASGKCADQGYADPQRGLHESLAIVKRRLSGESFVYMSTRDHHLRKQVEMSFSIEASTYKKECDEFFGESSKSAVASKSVNLFNRYIEVTRAWEQELRENQNAPNPFFSDDWNNHIHHLSSCLEQRINARRETEQNKRDNGHEFMIHVLIMHYFFLSLLRSLDSQKMSKLTLKNITTFKTMKNGAHLDYEKDSMLYHLKKRITEVCANKDNCLLYSLDAIHGEKLHKVIGNIRVEPHPAAPKTPLEDLVTGALFIISGVSVPNVQSSRRR